jgi:hypothetical protein
MLRNKYSTRTKVSAPSRILLSWNCIYPEAVGVCRWLDLLSKQILKGEQLCNPGAQVLEQIHSYTQVGERYGEVSRTGSFQTLHGHNANSVRRSNHMLHEVHLNDQGIFGWK